MRPAQHRGQAAGVDLGVQRGGAEPLVPEELLDLAHVRAARLFLCTISLKIKYVL